MTVRQTLHYQKVNRNKGFRFNQSEIRTIRRFLHQRVLEYKGAIGEMLSLVRMDDTGWAQRNLLYYEHCLACCKMLLRRAAQEQRWMRRELEIPE